MGELTWTRLTQRVDLGLPQLRDTCNMSQVGKSHGHLKTVVLSLLEAESHVPGVAVVALLAHWLEVDLAQKHNYIITKDPSSLYYHRNTKE